MWVFTIDSAWTVYALFRFIETYRKYINFYVNLFRQMKNVCDSSIWRTSKFNRSWF